MDDLFLEDAPYSYHAREQLLRVARLREMAELFWFRSNYEDTLNHYFNTIEFHEASGGRLDMVLRMRRYATNVELLDIGGFNTMAEIRNSQGFRRMLTHIWNVRSRMYLHTGVYAVFIDDNNRLQSRHTPNPLP